MSQAMQKIFVEGRGEIDPSSIPSETTQFTDISNGVEYSITQATDQSWQVTSPQFSQLNVSNADYQQAVQMALSEGRAAYELNNPAKDTTSLTDQQDGTPPAFATTSGANEQATQSPASESQQTTASTTLQETQAGQATPSEMPAVPATITELEPTKDQTTEPTTQPTTEPRFTTSA